jgi:hypothetical protein
VDGQRSALGQHVHSPPGGHAVVRILEGAVACSDADGKCLLFLVCHIAMCVVNVCVVRFTRRASAWMCTRAHTYH